MPKRDSKFINDNEPSPKKNKTEKIPFTNTRFLKEKIKIGDKSVYVYISFSIVYLYIYIYMRTVFI